MQLDRDPQVSCSRDTRFTSGSTNRSWSWGARLGRGWSPCCRSPSLSPSRPASCLPVPSPPSTTVGCNSRSGGGVFGRSCGWRARAGTAALHLDEVLILFELTLDRGCEAGDAGRIHTDRLAHFLWSGENGGLGIRLSRQALMAEAVRRRTQGEHCLTRRGRRPADLLRVDALPGGGDPRGTLRRGLSTSLEGGRSLRLPDASRGCGAEAARGDAVPDAARARPRCRTARRRAARAHRGRPTDPGRARRQVWFGRERVGRLQGS